MLPKQKRQLALALTLILATLSAYTLYAQGSLPVEDDPLVRLPGTQPHQVTLEGPNRCMNCHGDYDQAVEPAFNWKGSMMAQAARDPLFWACMVVAGQDSSWATGRPNAVDICERCHFPQGWLEGRSDPVNASLMTGTDYDGVHCDFCHQLYDPFFEGTHELAREGDLDGDGTLSADEWRDYWDETNTSPTPSQPAAATTYAEDSGLATALTFFNGDDFYGTDNLPVSPAYDENGAGQYFVSTSSKAEKRASFADATGRHDMLYSRYHKSKYFCNTCHDVSNPVLANLTDDPAGHLTTETEPAYAYYHVERTSSEFMLSAYAAEGGAPGIGPFAPDQFDTSYPNNYIAKCQDCHMPDQVGKGAGMKDAPVRPTESTEHPNSGQPQHDLTGGNVWISTILASAVPGSPGHDPVNEQLLYQGPALITLDMTQGDSLDPAAILAGADRAMQQLELAAAIEDLNYEAYEGALSFYVQNQTGHKLISGFPEGRRMFVNVKAYAGGALIFEVNPYDATIGTLKGLPPTYSPNSPPLDPNEAYVDELVYEMHPSSDLTGEAETFHFALATGRYKDNRIPPKGFRIDDAPGRLSQPVWHGADAPGYFSEEEYAGGYDEVELTDYGIQIEGADYIEVNLYYQTTSREYIEFLRDEIDGTASTLPPEAYIVQSDPFFAQLRAWGSTIWQLWEHNMDQPGGAPILMTQATLGVAAVPEVYLTTAVQTVPEDVGTVTVQAALNRTTDITVTVPYTVGGTATPGADHNLSDGVIEIPPGATGASLEFQVVDDELYERAETVIISLGTPSGAVLGTPAVQTITILDNDDPPGVAFSSPAYSTGEAAGSTNITVTLTGATALTATVDYATGGGTATPGEDYIATSGTLTFSPGVNSQAFPITILDDDLYEGDETIGLTLSQHTSSTLGLDSATLTIVDDDPMPALSIDDVTASEGAGYMTFRVTLSAASGLDAAVDFTTHDGTAIAGVDYVAASGTLTLPAGTLEGQITIHLIDNLVDQGARTFTVDLSHPVDASLDKAQGVGTILDNDGAPEIAFSSTSYSAGEAAGSAHITVTLTGATALTVTVDYATGGGTATPGEDYIAASGTLTFSPGVNIQSFSVPILDDDLYEGDETVGLALHNNAQGADLGLSIATLTIVDDDPKPEIAFSSASYSASEAAGTTHITVTLSGATALTATVDYATGGGTATPGQDYLAASGTLTFTPGVTSQVFPITILDNDLHEGDKTVGLSLSSPSAAKLGLSSATLTIVEDDAADYRVYLPVVVRNWP